MHTRILIHRIVLLAALILAPAVALAQESTEPEPDPEPGQGDVWVDRYIDDISRYGTRYRAPFVDELVRYHNAPRELVEALLTERRWPPGDVYFACASAHILGRPCRYVVERWQNDRSRDWDALAAELGVAPGSPRFHRIKRGFVDSYARWSRPIVPDEELRGAPPKSGDAQQGVAVEGDDGSATVGNDRPEERGDSADGASRPGTGERTGRNDRDGDVGRN